MEFDVKFQRTKEEKQRQRKFATLDELCKYKTGLLMEGLKNVDLSFFKRPKTQE